MVHGVGIHGGGLWGGWGAWDLQPAPLLGRQPGLAPPTPPSLPPHKPPPSQTTTTTTLTRQQVREEQQRVRPDPSLKLNGEVLAEMPYTRQVGGVGCIVWYELAAASLC